MREPTTDDGVGIGGAENGGLRLEFGRQLAENSPFPVYRIPHLRWNHAAAALISRSLSRLPFLSPSFAPGNVLTLPHSAFSSHLRLLKPPERRPESELHGLVAFPPSEFGNYFDP